MQEQFITFGGGHDGSIQSPLDGLFNEADGSVKLIPGRLVKRRVEDSYTPIESKKALEEFNVRKYKAKNGKSYFIAFRDDYEEEITDDKIERAIEIAGDKLNPIQ